MEPSAVAKQACSAAPTLGLPDSVLISILQRLPQRDRYYAARVSKPWAAAATAATTDVVVSRFSVEAFGSWVQCRGKAVVEAIRVQPQHNSSPVMLKLPCVGLARLAVLQLDKCYVQFVSSSSEQEDDAAVVLPALHSLTITNSCTVYMDTPPVLECPRLTELVWDEPSFYSTPKGCIEQLDTC